MVGNSVEQLAVATVVVMVDLKVYKLVVKKVEMLVQKKAV
jgi:hypothetical protein